MSFIAQPCESAISCNSVLDSESVRYRLFGRAGHPPLKTACNRGLSRSKVAFDQLESIACKTAAQNAIQTGNACCQQLIGLGRLASRVLAPSLVDIGSPSGTNFEFMGNHRPPSRFGTARAIIRESNAGSQQEKGHARAIHGPEIRRIASSRIRSKIGDIAAQ